MKPWHSECIPNRFAYYTAKNYGLAFFVGVFFCFVLFFSSFPSQLVQVPVKESIAGNTLAVLQAEEEVMLTKPAKKHQSFGTELGFCVTWSVPGAGMRRGRTLHC